MLWKWPLKLNVVNDCPCLNSVEITLHQMVNDGCSRPVNLHYTRELCLGVQSINWSSIQWDHASYFTFLSASANCNNTQVFAQAVIQQRKSWTSIGLWGCSCLPIIVILWGILGNISQKIFLMKITQGCPIQPRRVSASAQMVAREMDPGPLRCSVKHMRDIVSVPLRKLLHLKFNSKQTGIMIVLNVTCWSRPEWWCRLCK